MHFTNELFTESFNLLKKQLVVTGIFASNIISFYEFYAQISCLFALVDLETLLFISNYDGLKQNFSKCQHFKVKCDILCKLAQSIKNNIAIFIFLIYKSLMADNHFVQVPQIILKYSILPQFFKIIFNLHFVYRYIKPICIFFLIENFSNWLIGITKHLLFFSFKQYLKISTMFLINHFYKRKKRQQLLHLFVIFGVNTCILTVNSGFFYIETLQLQ